MKTVVLGIDIGGTNTEFGLVDETGKSYHKQNIETNKYKIPEDFVATIYKHIQTILAATNQFELVGIGIGAPNGNFYNGTIEYAPNLKWKGVVNLNKLFNQYFNVPVYVTNDANAAALGEKIYGDAQKAKNFAVITLGTGLGSGIVINNQLVYGADGFAGELGHTIVEENGRECSCGRKGCLETYVSASGIVRTARILLAQTSKDSLLRKVSDDELTSLSITEAAQKGDTLAIEIFEFTAKKLGFSLANYVAITSPELIILFGGLAKAGALLLQPTKKYMEYNLLQIFKDKVEIKTSGIKEGDAAILGASSIVWNEIKQKRFEKLELN